MAMRFTKFSPKLHQAKAAHNRQFAAAVATLENGYQDWQTIALFYAAVHLVQGYFVAATSIYPQNHQDRDEAILNDPHLRPIYKQYRELKEAALNSRYLCLPVNDFDVSNAQKNLSALQVHLDGLLAPPAKV